MGLAHEPPDETLGKDLGACSTTTPSPPIHQESVKPMPRPPQD